MNMSLLMISMLSLRCAATTFVAKWQWVCLGDEGLIVLWDTHNWKPMHCIGPHIGRVSCLEAVPANTSMIVAATCAANPKDSGGSQLAVYDIRRADQPVSKHSMTTRSSSSQRAAAQLEGCRATATPTEAASLPAISTSDTAGGDPRGAQAASWAAVAGHAMARQHDGDDDTGDVHAQLTSLSIR